jgi:spermidine synthase
MKPSKQPSPKGDLFLLLSIFILGFAVLVVEILGARMISPYFGSSVYVWSAQITVTLAALAAGYLAGGSWADKRPRLDVYFKEVLVSGVLLVIVPFLKKPVLSAATSLGLMGGSLVSAIVLFAPALFLMSATGPLAIRLLTADIPLLGRGVGKVYAVSTVGSVLGALMTGFFLVSSFSVKDTFFAVGLGLVLLGGAGLWLAGRPSAGGASSAAALVGLAMLLRAPAAATGGLFDKASFYGDVRVTDLGITRVMLLDGIIQGAVNQITGEGGADVLYYLESAALFPKTPRRALMIGLGAGTVPMAFEKYHGMATDVVEIDPVVAEAARACFGFAPRGRLAVEDGRAFLEHSRDLYDVIVLDAFASERAPFHLFSRESFEAVRRRLAPGGVFAINTVGHEKREAWVSVHKTLSSVFPTVRLFMTEPPPNGLANMVFIAGDGAGRTPDGSGLRLPAREALERMLAREVPPPSPDRLARASIFTDDFNPMDAVYRDIMTAWRRSAQEMAKELFNAER